MSPRHSRRPMRCPISSNLPTVDALERRRFFSASVVGGVLVVTGTDAADNINVYAELTDAGRVYRVTVARPGETGESHDVPAAGVRSILVRALAGDDSVNLVAAPTRPNTDVVRIPSRIEGGSGNDVIAGTVMRDLILGGLGDDRVQGLDGGDLIEGGLGNDHLDGGTGNDYVSGGFGEDTVIGNEGDDRLFGGAGNDHVGSDGSDGRIPEPGNDLLFGGSGEDWMSGGAGRDRIFGGTGRDHFSSLDNSRETLDRRRDEPKDVPVPATGFITFEFTGTVTRVSARAGYGAPPVEWAAPGATFRGTYTFNPAAPDTAADPVQEVYTTSPNGAVRVAIGEFRWSAPASFVALYNHAPGGVSDIYEAGDWIPSLELVSHPDLAASYDQWNFTLRMVDADGTLLEGPGLPLAPPAVGRAEERTLVLTGDNGMNTSPSPLVTIEARLDALTLVPTPVE
jgi:hypothetical protein